MNKFYFNTGVRPENAAFHLYGNQVLRGGTVQIPFVCDAPADAVFKFACDSRDLPESMLDGWVVCEIQQPSGLLSKYAYFKLVN